MFILLNKGIHLYFNTKSKMPYKNKLKRIMHIKEFMPQGTIFKLTKYNKKYNNKISSHTLQNYNPPLLTCATVSDLLLTHGTPCGIITHGDVGCG